MDPGLGSWRLFSPKTIPDHPQRLYLSRRMNSLSSSSTKRWNTKSWKVRSMISNLKRHHRHPEQIKSLPQNESGQTLSSGGGQKLEHFCAVYCFARFPGLIYRRHKFWPSAVNLPPILWANPLGCPNCPSAQSTQALSSPPAFCLLKCGHFSVQAVNLDF